MFRPAFLITVCALGSLASACGGPPAAAPRSDVCAEPLLETADWTLHDEGMFTILVPSSYGSPERHGFDSYAASWEDDSKILAYDWGLYSNPLADGNSLLVSELSACDPSRLHAERVVVGGFSDGSESGVVAAHWTGLEDAEALLERVSLTVSLRSPDASDVAEFHTILSSVVIRDPGARRAWPGVTGVVVCGTADAPEECHIAGATPNGGVNR
jgi:hypothetical protein